MKGKVIVIYGFGKGKTTAAVGNAIRMVADGKTVNIIQFLKGNREGAVLSVLEKLEPDLKVFRFEKHTEKFNDLDDAKKNEELLNIRNGLNFAKKVLSTESADVLVLDEILGLVDRGIMEGSELCEMIKSKPEEMDLIITGRVLNDDVRALADSITKLETER